MLSPPNPDRISESLSAVMVDKGELTENGLFAGPHHSNALSHFDILRTRVSHAMNDRDWIRIATTAPPAEPCC